MFPAPPPIFIMVTIKSFTTKKGREVKYLEIEGGTHFPVRLGIKKALAVLEHSDEIRFMLSDVA